MIRCNTPFQSQLCENRPSPTHAGSKPTNATASGSPTGLGTSSRGGTVDTSPLFHQHYTEERVSLGEASRIIISIVRRMLYSLCETLLSA